uniref:EGF-like domain-containing protein n=1 Tax=Rhabditophanes sp. KR3021 TaxID=114890 RepID=A0AC35TPA3_9BILA
MKLFNCWLLANQSYIFLLLLIFTNECIQMKFNPERMAARLRIDNEFASRGRRQLGGNPKEINIQVTAPLFASRLFDFGPEIGDEELPQETDFAKQVSLRHPITFYGKQYTTMNVLANGALGFDEDSKHYRLNILPGKAKLIAPFWNRNDLKNGGQIFYREITSGKELDRGRSEIRYQYDKDLKIISAFVVTWSKMQPISKESLPEENTNTVQLAIFNTNNGSYANFIYSAIGWTQGAEAGFSKGDGKEFFSLPTSGTGNIMFLMENGNTGIPGEWMFALNENKIVRCKTGMKGDTCDEDCGQGHWGEDCQNCCHCTKGSCNSLTGECNEGGCSSCYSGKSCSIRSEACQASSNTTRCASNAVAFSDFDKCGENIQKCTCLSGYEGDGKHSCTDINECDKVNTCHKDANCVNTPGKYFCTCRPGFKGDGETNCELVFFYPITNGNRLPQGESSATFSLRNALQIFGAKQRDIVFSEKGYIGFDRNIEHIVGNKNTKLGNVDVAMIAPFYSAIDLNRGGSVEIEEVTENKVLQRATRTISDALPSNKGFMATSVVIITYNNVTTSEDPTLSNSFQVALIGGRARDGGDATYAHLLFKDIQWTNAESGIVNPDNRQLVELPGAYTQLPTSSNIGKDGEWVYQIDSQEIPACLRDYLEAPYCDRESVKKTVSKTNQLQVSQLADDFAHKPTSPTPLRQTQESDDDLETDRPVPQHVTFPPSMTIKPEIMMPHRKNTEIVTIVDPVQTIIPEINHMIPTKKGSKFVLSTKSPSTTTASTPVTTQLHITISPQQPKTTQSSIIKAIPTTESIFVQETRVTESKPIFVFSTVRPLPTKKSHIMTIEDKLTTSTPIKKESSTSRFDLISNNGKLEDAPDTASLLIPTAIVAFWLLIIGIVIVVLCCRSRKKQSSQFATIYGPAYQVHPLAPGMTAPYGIVRKTSGGGYDDYEDGLEKQERMPTQFSGYNENTGRISFYGPFWNLPTPLTGLNVGPIAFCNPATNTASTSPTMSITSSNIEARRHQNQHIINGSHSPADPLQIINQRNYANNKVSI